MAAENNSPFENKTPWSVYVDFFYKYFVFSGRSSRYDYWAFIFTNSLVTVVLALLAAFDQSFYIIYYAYSLFTIIPFYVCSLSGSDSEWEINHLFLLTITS